MAADAPAAFFSYSRDDSEFALRLAEDLKAAGAAVWIDQLDIEPGSDGTVRFKMLSTIARARWSFCLPPPSILTTFSTKSPSH